VLVQREAKARATLQVADLAVMSSAAEGDRLLGKLRLGA